MFYLMQPMNLILISLVISIILLRRAPRFIRVILLISTVFLYLLSTKVGVYYFGKMLYPERAIIYPALSLTDLPQIDPKTTAIVVLGYGRYAKAPSYGRRDIISSNGLVRIRYAARLHKKTGAPLLLTGNSGGGNEEISEAQLMQEVLNEDFGITENILLETKSSSTYENAKFSTSILKANNIKTIILVTHRGHMSRAIKVFEQFPFRIIPAPLGIIWKETILKPGSFIPAPGHLATNTYYWYQFMAKIYYRLSGKFDKAP